MAHKTPKRGKLRATQAQDPKDVIRAAEAPLAPCPPMEGTDKEGEATLPEFEAQPYVRLVPPGVAEREADLIYGLMDALKQCLACLECNNGKIDWSAEHDSEIALRRFEEWTAAACAPKK